MGEEPAPPITSGTSPGAANTANAPLGTPDGQAHLLQAVTIVYPALSVRLGEAGKVTVALELAASGQANSARVVRSSGFSRLDQAALQALAAAPYAPAVRNGQAVPSQKEITVDFRLKQGVEITP